jgi:hypothetical protein
VEILPEKLVAAFEASAKSTGSSLHFLVQVHAGNSQEVMYSFESKVESNKEEVTCSLRKLDQDGYVLDVFLYD